MSAIATLPAATAPALLPDRSALKARPATEAYRREMDSRFAQRPMFCAMEMIGSTPPTPRKPYQVAERVAVIDIAGMLVMEAWYLDETAYGEIQYEVAFAREDPDVDAILLRIASPGGETDGAFETAAMIADTAKSKPVYAVADPYAYSAAYLLASPAKLIYAQSISGGVGSIGVYALHLDYSGYLAQAGIKPTFVTAGKGKTEGNPFEPLSKEAFANWQAQVNRLYGEFVAAVASGRKLSESAIIKLGAALFEGSKAALGSGLADRVGSAETAWLDLATKVAQTKLGSRTAADAEQQGASMGVEQIEQPTPTPTPQPAAAAVDLSKLKADAVAEGKQASIDIINLCTIAGKPALANDFIKAGKSASEVQATLLEQRAAASDAPGEIRSGVLTHHAADAAKPSETLKQRMEAKGKREGWLK